MVELMLLLTAVLFIAAFIFFFRREPRSIWVGVYFTFALFAAIAAVAFVIAVGFSLVSGSIVLVIALVVMAVLATTPLILGGFLAVNMIIMWRKEGLSPAAMISGVIGIALFFYTGAFYFLVLSLLQARDVALFDRFIVGAFPFVVFIGLAFVCFIVYTVFYEWYFSRFSKLPDAVVVLGAQVSDPNRLTPLLQSRVDHGISVVKRAEAAGKDTVLVLSGGQGPDEPCPEGEAMANYACSQGVDESRIIVEDRSTTTEENLLFSANLLRAREDMPEEPWIAVASSDYHAFRGALEMRRAHLTGYATGARTARYFWPSAKVREFIAIVVDYKIPVLIVSGFAILVGIAMSQF